MKLKLIISYILIAFALAVQALPAHAQQNSASNKAQAAQKAQQQVKGRVLRVDQTKNKYRVKMLQKSGRVVNVDIDRRQNKVPPPKNKQD